MSDDDNIRIKISKTIIDSLNHDEEYYLLTIDRKHLKAILDSKVYWMAINSPSVGAYNIEPMPDKNKN